MTSSMRVNHVVYLVAVTLLFWLGMQAVHEMGHVAGAVITRAEIHRVVLHPLKLSETVLGQNPAPALVALSGTLGGSVIPVLSYALVRHLAAGGSRGLSLVRAFAGFCLISNGVYLTFGPKTGLSDTGVMISTGWSPVPLRMLGIVLWGGGTYLWNGLGRYFGIGTMKVPVRHLDVAVVSVLLISLILVELFLLS